ncbi:MAG: hypothetical protein EPN26_05215 [Rhodospirillales bacterium]|nr:MAG: hypothetical protein EPN26_05215 [Rhodospirillales bacterium]
MKVLFLALLAVIAWYGFKLVDRRNRMREELASRMAEAVRRSQPPASHTPSIEADDLSACPVCGTFGVPGRVKNCGRPDCPYPG